MTGQLLYHNLHVYLFAALFLLGCGFLGVMYRRTLIGMLISLELVMNGAGLNLVALNAFSQQGNAYGIAFTLFIMGIAAAEAAIALGIIIAVFRRFGHIEGGEITELKG
jgi:NADH:ubiquinone oxidoreductase subunit K